MESLKSLENELNSLEERMEKRLKEVESKIDSIDDKLTQVVDAILGNPLTHSGGFVEKINELEQKILSLKKEIETLDISTKKEIKSLQDFKSRVYWTIGIISVIMLAVKWLSTIYLSIK